MKEFLEQLRNSHSDFNHGELGEELKSVNPMELFKKWLEVAYDSHCPESNAMTISTVGNDNMPSSRIVYLKELTDDGLVFYTNYESKKGKDIVENPQVSALFFWEKLSRQIRVQGLAEKTPESVSDLYFDSRPRESKIGAWASRQSESILDRNTLENKFKEIGKRFEEGDIPRPDFWGGYLIRPIYIEFWQGRPNRLHDRICFERKSIQDNTWFASRINP